MCTQLCFCFLLLVFFSLLHFGKKSFALKTMQMHLVVHTLYCVLHVVCIQSLGFPFIHPSARPIHPFGGWRGGWFCRFIMVVVLKCAVKGCGAFCQLVTTSGILIIVDNFLLFTGNDSFVWLNLKCLFSFYIFLKKNKTKYLNKNTNTAFFSISGVNTFKLHVDNYLSLLNNNVEHLPQVFQII